MFIEQEDILLPQGEGIYNKNVDFKFASLGIFERAN